jgi:hypothetical protein
VGLLPFEFLTCFHTKIQPTLSQHTMRKFTLTAMAISLAGSAFAQAPANDDCAGALTVVDGPNGPFDNSLATDSPEAWPCGGAASADLWFSYTATASGQASASTCGSTLDTKIEVFDGACGALVSLVCNDDACSFQSTASWAATAGTTYLVRVGGWNGSIGTFGLDMSVAPAVTNDECSTAIAVVDGTNGPFFNLGATNSPEIWPCGNGGSDVWFSYTASKAGEVTIDVCGGDYDSCMEVFDGACGALVSLACNDDFCTLQSSVTFAATAGTTYYVRVGGFNGSQGNFPINIVNEYAFDMVGAAETVPGSATLLQADGVFVDGDTLRWNFADPLGLAAGKFAAVIANLQAGGAPAVASTPAIPGFIQLWSGSTPAGLSLTFPPLLLPSTDQSTLIPAGLFLTADVMRVQGLVLDPAAATGALPVIPTRNALSFTSNAGTCQVSDGFESAIPPALPTGWVNGGGSLSWLGRTGTTPSSGTGPAAAAEGLYYMYCETSSPATTGSTWIVNSPIYANTGMVAVTFQLSRVGDGIGDLEVRMDDGTGTFPTLLRTYTGNSASDWTQEVIGLPAGAPANLQFQFHYTYGGSFRGDIAIDDFCLK